MGTIGFGEGDAAVREVDVGAVLSSPRVAELLADEVEGESGATD